MTPEEAGRLHAAANRRWGRVLTDHEIADVYKTWLAREQPSGLLRRFTAAFRAEEARLRGEGRDG